MSMTSEQSPSEFSDAWLSLGVVTAERLASQRVVWARGGYEDPQHFLLCAFDDFLRERCPLSAELAAALYGLGERERDETMGQSMMLRIVQLPKCPASVLDAAVASGQRDLIRAVERRRADVAGGALDAAK
jgi:hypothetical protein